MVKLIDYKLQSIAVPFRLSWGKLGYSRHVYLTLQDDKGKLGQGEGVLYKSTHLELLPYLERNFSFDLEKLATFEPALAFALDTALLDIEGKILPTPPVNPPIVREIFLDDHNLELSLKQIVSRHTSAVKLKVGAGLKKDLETINKVCQLTGGKLPIHLDANRAYPLEQALVLAQNGKNRGVTLFEEPIVGDFGALREFRQRSHLPLMLDESIQSFKALDQAIKEKCFDILNIKLSRLGGITLAQKYVEKCVRAGVKIYLGCSEEQEVGTAAIFTLAKSLKNLYALEGLGTERLSGKKGFHYTPGKDNRLAFLFKEFYGLWTTRIENYLNYALTKTR